MPHIVIEGPVSVALVHRELAPFEQRDGNVVFKLRESFLSRGGHLALLEVIVVEGTTRRFLVEAMDHDGHLTLRLNPLTDPEKTDGVKRLLGQIAMRVVALADGSRIARTNIAAWIPELKP